MAKKATPWATDRVIQDLEEFLTDIKRDLKRLARKLDAESVIQRARLMRLYAQTAAEKRKAEKEDRRAGAALTIPIVIAWAKTLDPAERAELARQLQQLDDRRSVLA